MPQGKSSYSVQRHILSLFDEALKRFTSVISLRRTHLAYLSQLRPARPRLVSQAFASAVSALPSLPDFWILASQFESVGLSPHDDNEKLGGGDWNAARKLCLRGLRFNRDETSLWLEWIRVECDFALAMRDRQNVLDGGARKHVEVEEDNVSGEEENIAVEVPEHAVREEILDGRLARLAIDNALQGLIPPFLLFLWLSLLKGGKLGCEQHSGMSLRPTRRFFASSTGASRTKRTKSSSRLFSSTPTLCWRPDGGPPRKRSTSWLKASSSVTPLPTRTEKRRIGRLNDDDCSRKREKRRW